MVLRVAVIGCGRMGAHTRPELKQRIGQRWLPLSHAEASLAVEGLELVGLCDVNAETLSRAQQEHRVDAGYADYKKMLTEVQPDIVTVATRTAERPQILLDCAQAGVRGIHCEKPLSTTLAEAETVANALSARGVAITYGTLRRYMPIYDEAAAAVFAGEIGDVQQIVVKFGRSALLWTHPHSIDLICRFAGDGKVRAVQAMLDVPREAISAKQIDADPIVLNAVIEFENGILGTISAASGLDLEVMGSKGQLTIMGDGAWRWIQPAAVNLSEDETPKLRPVRPQEPQAPAIAALEELRDLLNDGLSGRLLPADIVAQQRLIFAIAQSHLEGGKVVDPADVDPQLRISGLTGARYA